MSAMYRVANNQIQEIPSNPLSEAAIKLYAEEVFLYEEAKESGTLGVTIGNWFCFKEDAELFLRTGDDRSPSARRYINDLCR